MFTFIGGEGIVYFIVENVLSSLSFLDIRNFILLSPLNINLEIILKLPFGITIGEISKNMQNIRE